jgi:hypothetical protein
MIKIWRDGAEVEVDEEEIFPGGISMANRTYRYADPENSQIVITDGPMTMYVAALDGDFDYEWVKTNVGLANILPYVAPAAPVTRSVTFKSSLWRRCTDAEADTLVYMLSQQSNRFQRLFTDVTRLEHDSPEFALLQGGIAQAFGPARAAELLAPDLQEIVSGQN